MNIPSLPVTRKLSESHALSFLVALLVAIASLADVFFQSAIYPTEDLRRSFVPNDTVNVFLGLPILLGTIWLTRRGKLMGLLFLPGALFYVVYNYIAYLFAIPINVLSLVYFALVVLSAYEMIRVIVSLNAKTAQQRLVGAVPERLGAGVLIGFSVLFFLCAVGVVFSSHTNVELGVAVADLVTTPIWIAGGVMLWRRTAFGYTVGLGLVFQANLLFISLILVLLLQPLLTTAPLAGADIVAVLAMGLVCFVPFGLFAGGVASTETGRAMHENKP